MALDLEMNQPTDTIIQIGAVVGNINSGKILEEFSVIVHTDEWLCTDPTICDIPKLTGITDEMILTQGIPLPDAYNKLRDLRDKYDCYRNPIVWGGGDVRILKKQVEGYGRQFSTGFGDNEHELFCFGHRWLDAKTLFQSLQIAKGQSTQSGLAKAMIRMKIRFEGRKHSAKDDALNTFRIYRELIKVFK